MDLLVHTTIVDLEIDSKSYAVTDLKLGSESCAAADSEISSNDRVVSGFF